MPSPMTMRRLHPYAANKCLHEQSLPGRGTVRSVLLAEQRVGPVMLAGQPEPTLQPMSAFDCVPATSARHFELHLAHVLHAFWRQSTLSILTLLKCKCIMPGLSMISCCTGLWLKRMCESIC